MNTFFCDEDYVAYLQLIADCKEDAGVAVWAYCLMPNHVHMVVVPREKHGLARLFRQAHRQYTGRINKRNEWRGHLWQERFHSFVMDERHLMSAVRYVELNPVRAGLCSKTEDWIWSSARAHLLGRDDGVVTVQPMLDRVSDWRRYLSQDVHGVDIDAIRRFSSTGRPAGDSAFVDRLEAVTGRSLTKLKPGAKRAIK